MDVGGWPILNLWLAEAKKTQNITLMVEILQVKHHYSKLLLRQVDLLCMKTRSNIHYFVSNQVAFACFASQSTFTPETAGDTITEAMHIWLLAFGPSHSKSAAEIINISAFNQCRGLL